LPTCADLLLLLLLPQGILEGQTCTPSAPEPLAAILWAIFAVFGIVYALLGYRCLRAVGFLSGLMVGANGIFILQDFQITFLGKPADSALAIVAGLLGAVLGSTYPVASVLISAFAGALLSGAAMAVCVATFPDNEFGVSSKWNSIFIISISLSFSLLSAVSRDLCGRGGRRRHLLRADPVLRQVRDHPHLQHCGHGHDPQRHRLFHARPGDHQLGKYSKIIIGLIGFLK